MNKKIMKTFIIGIVFSLILTGCNQVSTNSDNPNDDKAHIDTEKEENNNNTNEDLGAFTEGEIKEMYGEDETVYEVVNSLIDSEMPNFELKTKDNEVANLYDLYPEGPYIVEIMGTWCPVCKDSIVNAAAFNKKQDIPLMMISPDESIDTLSSFIGDNDIPFYTGNNPQAFREKLDLPFVPVHIFVGEDNIIKMVGIGNMEVDFIEYIANRSF